MTPSALLFLVNPGAGGGRAVARLQHFLRRSAPLPSPCEVVQVRSPAEVVRALRDLPPAGIPVAAGGDGTIGLVAAGLRSRGLTDTPLAILPLGTANILARELGLGGLRKSLRALAGGRIRRIDVMRTSHPAIPLALVSISGGFEGRFLHRYARLRPFGRPLAALAAIALAGGRGATIALECDGEALLRRDDLTFSAGLYNTPCYLAGLEMSPGADIADGRGESAVYRRPGAYAATLAAAMRGGAKGTRAGVLRGTWRAARIESEGALQLDGEPLFLSGPLSVWMEPGALPVLVPPAD